MFLLHFIKVLSCGMKKRRKQNISQQNPRPYSISASATDASYYFGSITPLKVSGIDQNGRPTGVTAYDLTQWGMSQAQEDMERPFIVVPVQDSNDE